MEKTSPKIVEKLVNVLTRLPVLSAVPLPKANKHSHVLASKNKKVRIVTESFKMCLWKRKTDAVYVCAIEHLHDEGCSLFFWPLFWLYSALFASTRSCRFQLISIKVTRLCLVAQQPGSCCLACGGGRRRSRARPDKRLHIWSVTQTPLWGCKGMRPHLFLPQMKWGSFLPTTNIWKLKT